MSDHEQPDDAFSDGPDDAWFEAELNGPFLIGEAEKYSDLAAWKDAMDLVTRIYRLTGTFPDEAEQGISLDLRRRAVSVPSTIAMGYGRGTKQDLSRALEDVQMLLAELHTLISVSSELGYISEFETELSCEHAMQVKREVSALQQSIHGGLY
jgi:four helix bundle protein